MTSRHTVQPMAVTSAPAPAPWIIKGRGEYRLVWNEMMLSEPFRAVAKAWSTGYLSISISPRDTDPDNSLAKLALDLARLHVNDTDVANDHVLLARLFPELVKVRVTLGETLKVLFLGLGVLECRRDERLGRDGSEAL